MAYSQRIVHPRTTPASGRAINNTRLFILFLLILFIVILFSYNNRENSFCQMIFSINWKKIEKKTALARNPLETTIMVLKAKTRAAYIEKSLPK
ncbi:MAG: hypothetical protein IK094_03550 [Treponema sp.]|nr:hypothetical protein [Treponema sp.]